jgi:hypothetical protein
MPKYDKYDRTNPSTDTGMNMAAEQCARPRNQIEVLEAQLQKLQAELHERDMELLQLYREMRGQNRF